MSKITWTKYGYTQPKNYTSYIDVKKPTSTYTATKYDESKSPYAAEIAKRVAEQNQLKRPDAYQSQYTDRISSIADQMGNRKFSYDVNSDALFQQLKSLYNQQGMKAMADTQANAAAMTGGYGNSYGVAASQQAYQNEQNKLLDRIPELQQLALAQYQQEGQDLQNLYAMLSDMDTSEYGKYRDTVSDYLNDRDYLENAIANLRNMSINLHGQNEQNKYNASNLAWNNYNNSRDAALSYVNMVLDDMRTAQGLTETSKQNAYDRYYTGKDYEEKVRSNKANENIDWAKVNETIRSNKAGESLDWAKVNETIRSNQAGEKANDQSSTISRQQSDLRIANAKNGIMSKTEYLNSMQGRTAISRTYKGNKDKAYKAYVEKMLDKKDLEDDEKAYLMNYFGI